MTCFRMVTVWAATTLLCLHLGHCAEIIGGAEVKPHSLPHMALLEDSEEGMCGGTLVSLGWVLTAAHCDDIKKVLLGVHSMDREERTRQVRTVNKRVIHPSYNAAKHIDDLMLLKLDAPVKPSPSVKPLPLPASLKDFPAGTECTVAGWGATKNQGPRSNTLRSANVTVIDRAKCNSPTFYNRRPVITTRMVCAGSVDQNESDSCKGDSGGPLVCKGVFGGVTSFGIKCGIKTKPGVYTLLSKTNLKWIKKTIRK